MGVDKNVYFAFDFFFRFLSWVSIYDDFVKSHEFNTTKNDYHG